MRVSSLIAADLPAEVRNMPARTDDGAPWIRWVRLGEHSGWMTPGTRTLQIGENAHFWVRVYALCAEVGNGKLDAVHAIGPGILSVGGMGVTAASELAQALLHRCFLLHPERYMQVMFPALHVAGAFTASWAGAPFGASFEGVSAMGTEMGWTPCRKAKEAQIRDVINCGSDSIKWTSIQKNRAALWVQCVSALLRDAWFDEAQVNFAGATLPQLLKPETRKLIRWPENGRVYDWDWSIEQRMLWAFAMVIALGDEDGELERLLGESVKRDPDDAETSLRMCCFNGSAGNYSENFKARVLHTAKRVLEMFRFKSE